MLTIFLQLLHEKIIKSVLAATFFGFCLSVLAGTENNTSKLHGVSLVSPRQPVNSDAVAEVKRINARWVSIIPYAFINGHTPEVYYDSPGQWWGETSLGTQKLIAHAQSENLKIMIKPHLWVKGDGWAGDFILSTEAEWLVWEKAYTRYLLNFARIAEKHKVDMLSIGTELRQVVKARPAFWRTLIDKVKGVYNGKLTYSANWDNYQNVTFWSQLDYIGIDLYFPLSDKKVSSVNELKRAWKPIENRLAEFSKNEKKQVLFTEYGYKSAEYTAAGHWKTDGREVYNGEGQKNAYQALYETFWHLPWYRGGFLWKWHIDKDIKKNNTQFTPQEKPTEYFIKLWFE